MILRKSARPVLQNVRPLFLIPFFIRIQKKVPLQKQSMPCNSEHKHTSAADSTKPIQKQATATVAKTNNN